MVGVAPPTMIVGGTGSARNVPWLITPKCTGGVALVPKYQEPIIVEPDALDHSAKSQPCDPMGASTVNACTGRAVFGAATEFASHPRCQGTIFPAGRSVSGP